MYHIPRKERRRNVKFLARVRSNLDKAPTYVLAFKICRKQGISSGNQDESGTISVSDPDPHIFGSFDPDPKTKRDCCKR